VFGDLIDEMQAQESDLLLMGWQGGFNVGRIYDSPIQRIVRDLPADFGILKNRGFASVDNILLP
jgi:hypothetical protein